MFGSIEQICHSRRGGLGPAAIPKHYIKVAVVFDKPNHAEWVRRLNSRHGKTISPYILESMEKSFVYPSLKEGFDLIIANEGN